MAEHRFILKNLPKYLPPRLIFTPKIGKNSLKQEIRFQCEPKDSYTRFYPSSLQPKTGAYFLSTYLDKYTVQRLTLFSDFYRHRNIDILPRSLIVLDFFI